MATEGQAVNALFKLFAPRSPIYFLPIQHQQNPSNRRLLGWFVSFAAKIERCGEVTGTLDISGTALAVSGSSSSDFDFFARVCPAPHGDPDSLKNVLPLCICIESDIADDARTSLFSSPPLRASNH